jgi:hypothetical protein
LGLYVESERAGWRPARPERRSSTAANEGWLKTVVPIR